MSLARAAATRHLRLGKTPRHIQRCCQRKQQGLSVGALNLWWRQRGCTQGNPGQRHFSSDDTALAAHYTERLAHQQHVWSQQVAHKAEAQAKVQRSVKVTLEGGMRSLPMQEAIAGLTTPWDIVKESKELRGAAAVAIVNGEVWDLTRPLEGDSSVNILTLEHPEARLTLRHSAAHVVGHALERLYAKRGLAALLAEGPALPESAAGSGYFYDVCLVSPELASQAAQRAAGLTVRVTSGAEEEVVDLHAAPPSEYLSELPPLSSAAVDPEDFKPLLAETKRVVKDRHPFERCEMSLEAARSLFQHNPFKLATLAALASRGVTTVSVYKTGEFFDLCTGPHIPHTGWLKSMDLLSNSAAQYKGIAHLSLQRVYGVAFGDKDGLQTWRERRVEAQKRDHRLIGQKLELFMFHQSSPGSPFFLPHGTRVYNTLCAFIRQEYKRRHYEEVITPQIYDKSLWETSGHWANYAEDMFIVKGLEAPSGGCSHDHSADAKQEDPVQALKPMNCPGHCLIFASRSRSYRELPLRLADFSPLHRNELSGALGGLTRLRRFAQDDAHIFCALEQVYSEIHQCLSFVSHVYGVLGFSFSVALSTRPEKFVGTEVQWDGAEKALRDALNESQMPWTVNKGDGAFYGPKIDISVLDAIGRSHQCATIQLDFQLPQRFGLQFKGADGDLHTPVMVHRAILGSIERMMAVVLEHTAGRLPFWLSPRQIAIVPVAADYAAYAQDVADNLRQCGPFPVSSQLFIDVKGNDVSLSKNIRQAQISQYNLILVVGEAEVKNKTVSVRARDGGNVQGEWSLQQLTEHIEKLMEPGSENTMTGAGLAAAKHA